MILTVGVIGNGSWATALVYSLTENGHPVNWYVRKPEYREYIYTYGRNPKYLTSVHFNMSKLRVTISIDDLIEASDILLLAVPSAFLHEVLSKASEPLKGKKIISAVKGIVPETNEIVADYLINRYGINRPDFAMIAGPSHAEEVASEKLSYLTVASEHVQLARQVQALLQNRNLIVSISHDIVGTEFAAVAKNVYAIAAGICHGLGYGDNFQAVLVSSAVREMKIFMERVCRVNTDINESAYLGDLLVTMYSHYSRNRTFGIMIGKGYSVKYARMEMMQIAEGYYGARGIAVFMEKFSIDLPIARSVYQVLYQNAPAKKIFAELSYNLS